MAVFHRLAHRFFALGAGLSMALVFGIIFVNSLRRYTIGKSLEWGEELPIYLTVYGVMFGVALAYLQDRHIRFTILTDFLSQRARSRLFAAVDLATVAIGVTLAWSGVLFATRRGAVEASGLIGTAKALAQSTGAEWLVHLGRMGTWQSAMVFGGTILAIAAAIRFATRIREV
ncbi:MAG: TRAP transporter small permease [Hyphomicrobiales bacterium]|nr:TRAP transporter small permease [Hyphomicrobiales bacterium]